MAMDWRIIWLAGFFDGEGCIYFQKKGQNAYPGIDIATGTHFSALGRVIEALELLDIKPIVSVREKEGIRSKHANIKICKREDIIKFLSAIDPFLSTKSLRSAMMLAFFDEHEARMPLTEKCKRIVNEITKLNAGKGAEKKWL